MSQLLAKYGTYVVDLKLFKKLGLEPFETDTQEKLYVGEYKLPNKEKANVKIYVTCMPAQIWEFEVETEDSKKYFIRAGQGSLSMFWESVSYIADGFITVNTL